MPRLYIITIKTKNHTVHGLSWTAAPSPTRAWSRYIDYESQARNFNSDTRAGQIAELKRKEGARLMTVEVPLDGLL